MNVLAIDCTQKVFVAAVKNRNEWVRRFFAAKNGLHSVNINAAIDEILIEANMRLEDIDVFACNVGPGSFTGIRVGISTIKGFNFLRNKKLMSVNTFELLAYNDVDKAVAAVVEDNKGYFVCVVENGVCKTEPCHIPFEQKHLLPQLEQRVFAEGDNSLALAAVCDRKINNGEFVSDFEPLYIRKSQAEERHAGS